VLAISTPIIALRIILLLISASRTPTGEDFRVLPLSLW